MSLSNLQGWIYWYTLFGGHLFFYFIFRNLLFIVYFLVIFYGGGSFLYSFIFCNAPFFKVFSNWGPPFLPIFKSSLPLFGTLFFKRYFFGTPFLLSTFFWQLFFLDGIFFILQLFFIPYLRFFILKPIRPLFFLLETFSHLGTIFYINRHFFNSLFWDFPILGNL